MKSYDILTKPRRCVIVIRHHFRFRFRPRASTSRLHCDPMTVHRRTLPQRPGFWSVVYLRDQDAGTRWNGIFFGRPKDDGCFLGCFLHSPAFHKRCSERALDALVLSFRAAAQRLILRLACILCLFSLKTRYCLLIPATDRRNIVLRVVTGTTDHLTDVVRRYASEDKQMFAFHLGARFPLADFLHGPQNS